MKIDITIENYTYIIVLRIIEIIISLINFSYHLFLIFIDLY